MCVCVFCVLFFGVLVCVFCILFLCFFSCKVGTQTVRRIDRTTILHRIVLYFLVFVSFFALCLCFVRIDGTTTVILFLCLLYTVLCLFIAKEEL